MSRYSAAGCCGLRSGGRVLTPYRLAGSVRSGLRSDPRSASSPTDCTSPRIPATAPEAAQ